MSLDKNEKKAVLDYIDGFTEKNETMTLSNGTVIDILKYDGLVSVCIVNYKIEEINEAIKLFENELKAANGIEVWVDTFEQDFPKSNVLETIKKISTNDCKIDFDISMNENPTAIVRFIICIYSDNRRNIRKNKHLQQKQLEAINPLSKNEENKINLATTIDTQDLQTILSKIGKVAGCVKVFNIENIVLDIKNEFSNELKSAKGIWIEFELLPNESLFKIKELTDFIFNDINENCEVIIETSVNEDLPQNSVKCKLLFTGLE